MNIRRCMSRNTRLLEKSLTIQRMQMEQSRLLWMAFGRIAILILLLEIRSLCSLLKTAHSDIFLIL